MLSIIIVLAVTAQTVFGSCGLRQNQRIIGGVEAAEHSWPWQASLRSAMFGISFLEQHICGAAIINDKWLVTAAHCVDGQQKSYLKVVVGDHNKASTSQIEVKFSVKNVIKHEDYDGNSLNIGLPDDIALLEVNGIMEFNNYVQPACIPGMREMDFSTNPDCWITGWGVTLADGNENVLNELNIDVRTNGECSQAWMDGGTSLIHSSHVCVGHGQTGACNGDSGGPLVCKTDGRFVLVGVTSWGASGCQTAGLPSVYTRVSMYLEWIQNNINSLIY